MSSKQTYRVCFCFRRRFRLAAAEAPADIKEMFTNYSDNGLMDAEHLRRFMVDVQEHKDATVDDAQAIIDSLKHLNIFHRRGHGFNVEGFFKYLFSDDNPPINAKLGVLFRSLNLLLGFRFHDSCVSQKITILKLCLDTSSY